MSITKKLTPNQPPTRGFSPPENLAESSFASNESAHGPLNCLLGSWMAVPISPWIGLLYLKRK